MNLLSFLRREASSGVSASMSGKRPNDFGLSDLESRARSAAHCCRLSHSILSRLILLPGVGSLVLLRGSRARPRRRCVWYTDLNSQVIGENLHVWSRDRNLLSSTQHGVS